MSVACSCGVDGCPELGWPHEWDPIAAGDDCSIGGLGGTPIVLGTILPGGRIVNVRTGHKVTAPYVRYGSGYACAGCVDTSGDHRTI
jgi:hypothetical protein